MKLKSGFILKEVAGDIVVVPSGDTLNLDMMITLNETGAFLWKILETGADESELVSALLEEYDVTPEMAAECVKDFGEKLNENGFLE